MFRLPMLWKGTRQGVFFQKKVLWTVFALLKKKKSKQEHSHQLKTEKMYANLEELMSWLLSSMWEISPLKCTI